MYEVPAWHTVTLIELIWTLSGLFCFLMSLWDFRKAMVDRVLVFHNKANGIMRILAHGYVKRGAFRMIQSISILVVGIYADFQPALNGKNIITPTGIVLTASLFVLGVSVGLISLNDTLQRRHIRRELTMLDNH